ncbi:C2 calcium-dependent domain-containing protein 4C-like [Notolabrus celidotus]|uniref:C2 calcium-dependent domain-containing protein 4C-like n=1 Tax=Notolabrus celidotus TaxID=1203425 RepID=UPI0014901804|nr:C2 calcium-dependent domain-containing protein 4C-like [Notolabrus celidotus]XP_034559163.1 C2 calcium-dependent domain-containing protein 4C-like [Notolabrus celidotus]XP_034559164.1 C2 calcium-dependent domain-containing protein 4C-like [Notolabrus celidotus]XP_034559165.1 C2 calcium-dependent domain-containing protein 4C-like [Notolabrus celidotus]
MWLLEKLRSSVESSGKQSQPPQTVEAIPVSVYANVLTPEKIPDFFIPPKLICCPPEDSLTPEPQPCSTLRPSSSDHAICSQSPRARSSRSPCSPGLFTRNLQKSANRHIIQIESADEPSAGSADMFRAVNTNADPQSQTAMSLPYVPKAQTSYGFSTLVESPHTRRKESLFHSDPSSPLTSPNSQRRSQGGTLLAPADSNPYRYFSGGESDTCSSAESSPFNSPLLSRSASLLRSITQETQAKVFRAKRSLARHSSLSTDDCSSADNSPNMQRRRMRCPPSPAFRGSKSSGQRGAASDLLQREHTINLHKGGTVRLSTHYDAEAARLRVRVLAAEALYDRHTDPKSINCCVALYLNPGKQQKQRSTIIKNSRNPVFNEDFFFDSLPRAQVKSLAMKIKVVNKGTSLRRDVLLGEREVLLSELLADL